MLIRFDQVERLEPELGCVWQERVGFPEDWGTLAVLYQAKMRVPLR